MTTHSQPAPDWRPTAVDVIRRLRAAPCGLTTRGLMDAMIKDGASAGDAAEAIQNVFDRGLARLILLPPAPEQQP